ncbi:hypothetical protein HYY71_03520 [Candidatus Woesearchaeota archaeon]|nr:hypothetical protein [Candidatus Woesearchaeota archaeon]
MILGNCKYGASKTTLLMLAIVLVIFAAESKIAFAQESKEKYADLEKTEVNEDAQDALREYYGEVLATLGTPRFNTIAAKEDIAIINVTIDGKDKRILTRLRNGWLFPSQSAGSFDSIRAKNLIVIGNISLNGILYSDADTSFGPRRFFGIESANLRYSDEGVAKLANGEANISINPVLKELIGSYNIFLSAYGLTKGIYVSEKAKEYFVVKSVNPASNVAFFWMLSGVRNGFEDSYLKSQESKIRITAEINPENETTHITISGLYDEIQNQTTVITQNQTIEQGNQTSQSGFADLTANVVLSTDLSAILEPVSNSSGINDTNNLDSNIASSNSTSSPASSVLEFTIYRFDEDYIMNQTAYVSGLSIEQVRKSISFIYKQPAESEDEVIEEPLQNVQLDGIRKVNGSVIITLG